MQRRLLACLFVLGIMIASQHTGAQDCPGAPPTRLGVGMVAQVVPGLSNNLRSNPSAADERIGEIPSGAVFVVLAGPVCADNFNWWRVDYNGLNGWTVEGSGSEYYIQPAAAPVDATATPLEATATLSPDTTVTPGATVVPVLVNTPRPPARPTIASTPTIIPLIAENVVNSVPQIGGRARVFSEALEGLRLYGVGNNEAAVVGYLQSGVMVDVLDGPLFADNLNWWQIRDDNGLQGWVPDMIVEQSGLTVKPLIPVCPFTSGRLAFGANNVYTVDPNGQNLCNLTQDFSRSTYTEVRWSPDGTRLAFIHERNFFTGQISIINADGSNLQTIMPPDSNYSFLSWSPDGSYLAFLREYENDFYNQIWVVKLNENRSQVLTTAQTRKRNANWSPDSQWIAFSEIIPNFDQVEVVSADGSTLQTLLANLDNPALDMDWSPDGLQLAIALFGEGIYGIDSADGEKRLLMQGDYLAPINAPVWSPDGRLIAYWETAKASQQNNLGSVRNLMVMSAEGSGRRVLVPQVTVPLNGAFNLVFPPAWSPDGTRLAYASANDGITVVEISTGLVTTVYAVGASASPVWQPS